ARTTLTSEAGVDALTNAVREVASTGRLGSAAPAATPVRVADLRGTDTRPDPLRPPNPRPTPLPPDGGATPLWKNKWVWAGAALLAIGAGTGAAVAAQPKTNDRGYRVIVTPGS
ncbi:MAG TPA: hypothetical protein VMV18_04575, partial [bacterium]|nr:hypothetical protein [bacterium]